MRALPMTREEFDNLFLSISNQGRWGMKDERGTLNHIRHEHVVKAAQRVHRGISVSLAVPISTVSGPDNPRPAVHHMINTHDVPTPEGEPRFATDYLGLEFHGVSFTHMDALCHVSYRGLMYNGQPSSRVTSAGASLYDVATYAHGILGRGVLLDIPRLRNVKWLEPGEAITPEELEEAETIQGVKVGAGDILLLRTGHHRRRLKLGPWNCGYDGEGRAGLHATSVRWLHDRKVAAFLPDGDGETVPSNVEGIAYPIHILQIAAMGMACADSLNLEDLARICEREKCWEFLLIAAPLRLPKGTGSVFNPIAVF